MIRRHVNAWFRMASKLIEKIDLLAAESARQSKRPIEAADDDEFRVTTKKKKERQVPVYDGEYFFDFENCLRYAYPYDFKFKAYAKKRWHSRPIQDVYQKEFRVHSPNTLGYMFRSGKVTVNDKIVAPDYLIKNTDHIASFVHRHENPVLISKIDIVKETEDTLAINKPSSIPVHPTGKYRLNTVLAILSKEFGYKDLFSVHRLDRLTSGVLVFAKSSQKAAELSRLIASRTVEKEYICKVEGVFPEGETVCKEPLDVLDQKLGFRFVTANGKACLTKFKRLHTDGRTSIVHCKLETGRTHQIRVHLQWLGHPIANDPFYNSLAFGPNKGKGAEYLKLKTIEQLLEELYAEHPTGTLHGDTVEFELKCQELEQSLAQGEYYDDVNFKMAEEAKLALIRNELFEKHVSQLENSDEAVDSHIERLAGCEELKSSDLPYLHANKHMKFSRDKYDVNPTCELCHMFVKPPQTSSLILYLHAVRYRMADEVYFAEPPNWARFSDDPDYYSNLRF